MILRCLMVEYYDAQWYSKTHKYTFCCRLLVYSMLHQYVSTWAGASRRMLAYAGTRWHKLAQLLAGPD